MKCCDKDLEFIKRLDFIDIYQAQCTKCYHYYQKRSNGSIIYINTNSNEWVCNSCGGELSRAIVHHPVHGKEFSLELTGSGEVHDEVVPYCHKCEEVPSTREFFLEKEK